MCPTEACPTTPMGGVAHAKRFAIGRGLGGANSAPSASDCGLGGARICQLAHVAGFGATFSGGGGRAENSPPVHRSPSTGDA
eukprot:9067836-Pyramimonas_sp.AAC.1